MVTVDERHNGHLTAHRLMKDNSNVLESELLGSVYLRRCLKIVRANCSQYVLINFVPVGVQV